MENEESRLCADLGVGVGLRVPHYDYVIKNRPSVPWFEIVSENFMGTEGGLGGRPLHVLEQIRSHYPVVFHGVSMSIGSSDPLNLNYLRRLKELVDRFQPAWFSDHLCWTGVDGQNVHDLLPLPYTEEALEHVVSRIDFVQNFFKRRILIENVSSYIAYQNSEMTEWDFLKHVAEEADCGILLDINNIYVSSVNHCFDAMEYLSAMPKCRIGQFHLAGHTKNKTHLVDTHDHAISEPVWDLYRQAVRRFGSVSTLIERDGNIPEFSELAQEMEMAETISKSIREEMFGIENVRLPKSRAASTLDAMDHY